VGKVVPKKDSDRQLISFIIFLILFLLPVNPSFKVLFLSSPTAFPKNTTWLLGGNRTKTLPLRLWRPVKRFVKGAQSSG